MSVEKLIEKLKKESPEFRKEYEKIDLAFEVSQAVFEARISAGFSQEKLAKKMGTKQSSIARIESGASLPSLSFLEKIAKALGTTLLPPRFANTMPTNTATETGNLEESILSPFVADIRAIRSKFDGVDEKVEF